MAEGIPTPIDLNKILIAFAFVGGLAVAGAFSYYAVFPYLNQSSQKQLDSLEGQVELLSAQVDSLTLELERYKNPEKFEKCGQKVSFDGACKNTCSGVEFNAQTQSCEVKTGACCDRNAPFSTIEECNSACAFVQRPIESPKKIPLVFLQTEKRQYARGEEIALGAFNASGARRVISGELAVQKKNSDSWEFFALLNEENCRVYLPNEGMALPITYELAESQLRLFYWNPQHIDCTEFVSQGIQRTVQATAGTYRFAATVSFDENGILFDPKYQGIYSNEFTIQ